MAKSHGDGVFTHDQFRKLGTGVIFESGVLVFHPENIELEDDVYIGHNSILKGYYRGEMRIGTGTWIGQQCYFHSAGGLYIGRHVGIGPGVRILTSAHRLDELDRPILKSTIEFSRVQIDDDCDLGSGAQILPGVRIGRGAQIGAGAVVTEDVPEFAIAVGVPARVRRLRTDARPKGD